MLLRVPNRRILLSLDHRYICTINRHDQGMQYNDLHPLMRLATNSNTEQIQPTYGQFQVTLEFELSLAL